WRFYHYGPWTEQVWERISPVVVDVDAQERTFSSKYKEDHKRWSLQDAEQVDELISQLDRVLPVEVTSAVSRGVREHGSDTTSLLHAVYRTRPMLGTRPGAPLRFDLAVLPLASDAAPEELETSLTPKQQKKRKEALRTLREQVQQKLRQRSTPTLVAPPTPPSYDEEFFEGVRWLDSLAGEAPKFEEGQLHFSEQVWSAPGREEIE
ncbi:MAG TPA: hypothetical protein VK458_12090, partial [Myxococcaceae bacterium]|nr:hypothetical protein [Myxococcaceae bacterium]